MNECYNFLTITGERSEIKKILDTKEIRHNDDSVFELDYEINSQAEDNVYIQFISPWQPPINWLRSLVTDYDVTIHCEYEEEMMEIAGEITIDKYSFTIKQYTDWKQYYINQWDEETYNRVYSEEIEED